MSPNFTLTNLQFSFISHLPFAVESVAYIWKVVPGKLSVNGKCKLVNIFRGND